MAVLSKITTPVGLQVVGAASLTAGIGVLWGTGGALICAGVCAIVSGALAEVAIEDTRTVVEEEGVPDGPRSTD